MIGPVEKTYLACLAVGFVGFLIGKWFQWQERKRRGAEREKEGGT